jgi:hypothetical protein
MERGDEALMEDEAEAVSSSCLYGKESWHGPTMWWRRPEDRRHRGGESEETTPVGLTWILLDQKLKKIHAIDSVDTMDDENLK